MSDETLKPCPFCGGEAEPFNPFDTTDGTWTVLCSECASSVGFEQTRAEAIAAWNTRAATTIGKVQVEIEPVSRGTPTAEQVREAIKANSWAETSSLFEFNDSSYQAIADELNAMLVSGVCKNIAPEYLDFLCSECGFVHYHSDENDSGDGNDWAFCPQCGKAVKR